jgi:plasmid stabilization system protein ParE
MQINWSEQSRDDLYEIMSYVASSFGRSKAEEVLAEIRHSAELLKDFPMLGKSFVEDTELGVSYRSLPSKLNQIVYYIEEETITIVTVWQNRRDASRLKKTLAKPSK